MPLRNEHESQAGHNETLSDDLDDDGDYSSVEDWVLTLKFYAALHYVEAVLANQGIHSRNHIDRKKHIKREFSRSLFSDYQELKDWSEGARYECMNVQNHHLINGESDLNNIKADLGYI